MACDGSAREATETPGAWAQKTASLLRRAVACLRKASTLELQVEADMARVRQPVATAQEAVARSRQQLQETQELYEQLARVWEEEMLPHYPVREPRREGRSAHPARAAVAPQLNLMQHPHLKSGAGGRHRRATRRLLGSHDRGCFLRPSCPHLREGGGIRRGMGGIPREEAASLLLLPSALV